MGSRETEASLWEWDPVGAAREFISGSAFVTSDKRTAAALYSDLIRLRVWKREFFIDGLAGFEARNWNLTRLVQHCIKKIRETPTEIEKAASHEDISVVDDSIESLRTAVDELVEASEPVIAAVEIAKKGGSLSFLVQSIQHRAAEHVSAMMPAGDGRRIHDDKTKHPLPPGKQRSHFASNSLNTLFQKEAYKPVRVAVLDTGFSADSQWSQSFSGKVEKCFSCLPDKTNDYIDVEGHGTDVLYQVSRVCPNAKLFSYRVAHRVGDHLCADKEAVLNALERAVEKEKVHVINMSFGWQHNDEEVEEWLYKAQLAGILMFASVSNFGALSSTSSLYPARSPWVIAVDAADGLGEPASFNSSTETSDIMLRFTAPGQGVRGHNPEDRLDGTSYASPIAAGIAALVLEFAQQTPLAGDVAFKYLRKMEGMVRILNKMSVQKTNPKFKFLAPWKLLSDERGTFGGDGGPKSQRYHVARVIVEELRKIYADKDLGSKIAD